MNENEIVLPAESAKLEETPRSPTKVELKRAAQYQERRRRLLNQGVPEDKVDERIAQEDYERLPLEKKFLILHSQVVAALRGFSEDVIALQHNDNVIANAMDVNFRAVKRALEIAGVSPEKQMEIVMEVNEEMAREVEATRKVRAAASEKAVIENELHAAEKPSLIGSDEAVGAEIPEGATVFGG